MNKIYINGRFLTQPFSGVQRFATEMLAALDNRLAARERLAGADWTVLVPRHTSPLPDLKLIRIRETGALRGALWEQLDMPRILGNHMLLNFGSTGPLFYKNQIVTIHDAEVIRQPDNFRSSFRLWYRFLLPRLGRRARRILTVSVFSRNELAECFGIPKEKCRIVHNSAEHITCLDADTSVFNRHGIPAGGYVLCVGTGRRNKNTASVAEALAILNDPQLHLVIVGKTDPDVFRKETSSCAIPVHEVGYVTDPELRALYEKALCFVFPSLYEGFGIPPIEAMSCGCPVVASNKAAIPEVCGTAALYVKSRYPQEIANAVTAIRTDETLRRGLIESGFEQVKKYSWNISAERVLDTIEDLLADN